MILRMLVVVLFSGVSFSCVKRWNQDPIKVTSSDFRTTFPILLTSGKNDPLALKANWENIDAACNVARAAMVREAEGIGIRNRVISSLFSAAVGALAVSSTLYAILAKEPRTEVTAVLGLGAGVSTIPTFFFLGTDEREREVRARIAGLDAKRRVTLDAFQKLLAANSSFDDSTRELVDLNKQVEAATDEATKTKIRVAITEVNQRKTERFRANKDAEDSLSSSLLELNGACQ